MEQIKDVEADVALISNSYGEIEVMDIGFLIADGYFTLSDGEKIPYAICGGEKVPFSINSTNYCIHVLMSDD